jgi:hypothetical protein
MAPSIVQSVPSPGAEVSVSVKGGRTPLRASGSLEPYEKFEVTPVIGTEFARGIQLTELLSAPNSDQLIRDLAVLGNPPPLLPFGRR